MGSHWSNLAKGEFPLTVGRGCPSNLLPGWKRIQGWAPHGEGTSPLSICPGHWPWAPRCQRGGRSSPGCPQGGFGPRGFAFLCEPRLEGWWCGNKSGTMGRVSMRSPNPVTLGADTSWGVGMDWGLGLPQVPWEWGVWCEPQLSGLARAGDADQRAMLT